VTSAQLIRRLAALARPFRLPLAISAFWRIVGLTCGIVLLAVAAHAVATHAIAHASAQPAPIAGVVWTLVALSLLKGLARYLEQYAGHYVAFRALAQLRMYFYDHLVPQAPAVLEQRSSGDLLARVTKDVDRVEVFFAHTLVPAVTAVLVPLGTAGALAYLVHPAAALLALALAALVGVAIPLLGQRASSQAAAALRVARGRIGAHVTDSVQGVREVLAFGYGPRRLDHLTATEAPTRSALHVLGAWTGRRRGLNALVVALGVIGQFVLLWHLLPADLPRLALGLALTMGIFTPVLAVEDFAEDLSQAFASARRIFEVTDAAGPDLALSDVALSDAVVPAASAPAPVALVPGEAVAVHVKGVTFTYPQGPDALSARGEPALADVTFEARAGKVTAVVGASGSGKSTLAALLVRAFAPDAGAIELGGRDIGGIDMAQLREVVAMAAQRPYLFNDTIKANLLLARPPASAAELERAAATARLAPVIAAVRAGWEASVGEMGEHLSGGERQRLALAQVLLRRPGLLILDEATSQLDVATEQAVLAGVLGWAGDGAAPSAAGAGEDAPRPTCLLIAHRLATVRSADWIVVLDGGRVAQQGTYEELAQAEGPFAQLLAREVD
jgi:ABC-type multidrug transport system fused ATPase/permease subunit